MKKQQSKPGLAKGTKFTEIKRTAFGDRLFKILRSKKVSQRELGEKIGISNRMISYYETNEMGPPLSVLKCIASALGITVSYLVDESPLKIVEIDDTTPTLKKDIEILKSLSRKDQRSVSNMIAGLKAKAEQDRSKVAAEAAD
jgi:transcriptional regulator with XRE-family HTH domain